MPATQRLAKAARRKNAAKPRQFETMEAREMMTVDAVACCGFPDLDEQVQAASLVSTETPTNLGTVHGQQSRRGHVGGFDTRDDYRFRVDAAGEVTLRLDGLSQDIDLYLYNADGERIGRSWRGGSASESITTNLAAGEYTVRVDPWGSAISSYRLQMSIDQAGESLGSARDLGRLAGMTALRDAVGNGDTSDFYRFTLDDPTTVSLGLDGLSADVDLYLLDASGNEITRSWRGGSSSESIERRLDEGTYFVKVVPWRSATSNYRLTVEGDAGGDTMPAATDLGRMAGTRTITDRVEASDRNDFYRLELDDASRLRLALEGLSADIDLYLLDASGNEVTRSWRGGSLSESIDADLAAGVYYIRVVPWGSAQSDYRLSVNVDAGGESLADARDVGTLGATQTVTDWVGAGDSADLFRFTMGSSGQVNLGLDNLSADVDLYLLDSSGREITRSWRGGTSSESIQRELAAGTYYVRVDPWRSAQSDYRLTLGATGDGGDEGGGGDDRLPDVPDYGGVNDWNLNAINAPEAWAAGHTGQNVIVAVLDTGVDYTHVELAGSIWTNPGEIAGNGIDDDGNGFVDDVRGWDFTSGDNGVMDRQGHGTHVAGTIAGAMNGFGVTGVAHGAMIMPVQVLSDSGCGSNLSVAQGIRYAADNGAHVINMSLGGGGRSSVIDAALDYARELGVVVIASAGNESASTPGYPARFSSEHSNVLSVGAHTIGNRLAGFSNRVGSSGAVQVDAPGQGVYSSVPGNRFAHYSGTSMAAPHVAGLAALVLSANPNLSPEQVRSLLTQGAERTIAGSDSIGGVDAARSVAMAMAGASASAAPQAFASSSFSPSVRPALAAAAVAEAPIDFYAAAASPEAADEAFSFFGADDEADEESTEDVLAFDLAFAVA